MEPELFTTWCEALKKDKYLVEGGAQTLDILFRINHCAILAGDDMLTNKQEQIISELWEDICAKHKAGSQTTLPADNRQENV